MALSCLVYCTASQTLDETLPKIARARKNRWLLIQEACIVYVIKKAKRRIWMNFTLYSQQRGLRSPTTLGKVLVSCTVRLTFGIYPTPVRAFPDLPIILQTAARRHALQLHHTYFNILVLHTKSEANHSMLLSWICPTPSPQ